MERFLKKILHAKFNKSTYFSNEYKALWEGDVDFVFKNAKY